jgi:DNA gyrase subunit A
MVRLSKGYEALLHPFVDSKGNFGKAYSRDMAYAASRYTEAKLDAFCQELFRDIDADTVDFVDNYDSTMKEPSLLPTTFPNVLVSANNGIAVGMASNICGFNLREVCNTAIARIKDPNCDLKETLLAPDFPTGGELLYNEADIDAVYNTGRGSIKVRGKWRYVKEGNLVEIYEIPYTTTSEAILDKVAELIKAGKIKEISDMRDETDLSGLKLTIDLKRGVDPEKLMAKLMKLTTLQDSFPCNFNILIGGFPKVMGVGEILEEWTAWRTECVRRRVYDTLKKKQAKLHLLLGLQKILLDIDKAIRIIRETELEEDVVPNLMIGFGIDEIQANYIAEIKLRNINREYILKRTQETEDLEKEIADLEDTVNSSRRIKSIIIKELENVAKKYGKDRKTTILYEAVTEYEEEAEETPDYPVYLFVTRDGYLKKITPQSLRMSGEQKLKEGDRLVYTTQTTNRAEILVFTDRYQVYKASLSEFDDGKASVLGDYLPTKLGFEDGEAVLSVCLPGDYSGFILFAFENGKVAKVALSTYDTKSNRRRLTSAYSDKSPIRGVLCLEADTDVVFYASDGRALVANTALLNLKSTRSTIGVATLTLRKKALLDHIRLLEGSGIQNVTRYRSRSIPAAGAILKEEDTEEQQLSLEL